MISPDAQLNFHEFLYSLCERKIGCPLPSNEEVEATRYNLAVRMPTVRQFFVTEQQNARDAAQIKMKNPLMAEIGDGGSDEDDDSYD